MSHKKKHKNNTDFVEPDLPIVPMLDMSFQLMAFFLITFRPMPTEGQMALAIPNKDGGGVNTADPLEDEKAKEVIVSIYAGGDGRIAKIEVEDINGNKNLGAEVAAYQKALKEAAASALKGPTKKIGKLKLQIDKSLLHEYVVQLIDIGVRAGFTDISPEPLGGKKGG